jgi:hypothetical protein
MMMRKWIWGIGATVTDRENKLPEDNVSVRNETAHRYLPATCIKFIFQYLSLSFTLTIYDGSSVLLFSIL